MRAKSSLVIADPWETLDHERDSTLFLCEVGHEEFGVESFWTSPRDLFYDEGELKARLAGKVAARKLTSVSQAPRSLRDFEIIQWRMDPPVDLTSLRLWSLLTLCEDRLFVNPPRALFKWNEKFAPLHFRDWALPTLISESPQSDQEFFRRVSSNGEGAASLPGKIIAKPCADAASRGVRFLPPDWAQAQAMLARMRGEHGPWLVLQEADPSILTHGELRVFLVENQIAGAIHKKPRGTQAIMNLDAPEADRPQMSLGALTATQKERALRVAKALSQDGVGLATLDFIGDRILEINVTSPGLIQWHDERSAPDAKISRQYWRALLARTK